MYHVIKRILDFTGYDGKQEHRSQGRHFLRTLVVLLLCGSLEIMTPSALLWTGLAKDAFAGTVQLPQTGQKSCYSTNGDPIDCTETGQDGDKLMGVPWPVPRFTDNYDGTITDNLTGLMWTKEAGTPKVGSCTRGSRTWTEALKYATCVNATSYCGYSDWRLPNINELRSLANVGYNESTFGSSNDYLSSWLESQGFSNVRLNSYWSSTVYAGDNVSAWLIYMWNGWINYNYKCKSYNVWLVRSGKTSAPASVFKTGQKSSYYNGDDGKLQKGVAWPYPRFTDNRNGTVTDNLTGLIWLKNADCTDTVAGIYKSNGYLSWADALTWSNRLASGICGLRDGSTTGDWRLPNRDELESLIDFKHFAPPLSNTAGTGHWSEGAPFSNVRQGPYWTGSTDYNAPYQQNGVPHQHGAIVLQMWSASEGSSEKTSDGYVWPVRGGK